MPTDPFTLDGHFEQSLEILEEDRTGVNVSVEDEVACDEKLLLRV